MPIHGYAGRTIEIGVRGQAAIARAAGKIIGFACKGADDAVGIHLANHIISVIRNKHIAPLVCHRVIGLVQLGIGRRAAVPGIPVRAIARHRGNNPVGGDLANHVIVPIHDIKVAHRIQRYIIRQIDRGIGRLLTIAGISRRAIARHRRDEAVRADFPDDVVIQVGNEDVAVRILRHRIRPVQPRTHGGTTVTGVARAAIAGEGRDDGIAGPDRHRLRVRQGGGAIEIPLEV